MSRDYTVYYEYFRDDDAEGYNVIFPALPGIVTSLMRLSVTAASSMNPQGRIAS